MKSIIYEGKKHIAVSVAFDDKSIDPFYTFYLFTEEGVSRFSIRVLNLPQFVDKTTGEKVELNEHLNESLIELSRHTFIRGILRFIIPESEYNEFELWTKNIPLREGPVKKGKNEKVDKIFNELNC